MGGHGQGRGGLATLPLVVRDEFRLATLALAVCDELKLATLPLGVRGEFRLVTLAVAVRDECILAILVLLLNYRNKLPHTMPYVNVQHNAVE
jgi:hypothetical protein